MKDEGRRSKPASGKLLVGKVLQPLAFSAFILHPSSFILSAVEPRRVALFTGHMVDLPGRPTPRFPESAVPAVQARIASVLEEHNILTGYGSAACGADLLFLRAVLDRPGGEVRVVLPFERERFRRVSVVRVPEQAHWGEEFDRVLAAAKSVTELHDDPHRFEGNPFAYGNHVLLGMAEQKAREQDDTPVGFALWDENPAEDRSGGTADFVRQLAARRHRRVILSPSGNAVRQP